MKIPDSSTPTRIALTPGETFGALTVIESNVVSSRRKSSTQYRLRCTCGRLLYAPMQMLLDGSVVSCGCEGTEHTTSTHSLARLRMLWQQMVAACEDETDANFLQVGARGITLSEEWQDFATFASWADAQGYHDKLWVVRIDLAQNYSSTNCCLVIRNTYNLYQQLSHMVTAWGECKSVLEWLNDSRCAAAITTLQRRLEQSWNPEKAISTPHDILDKRGFYLFPLTQIPIGTRFGRQVVIGDYERIIYRTGSYAYRYPCRCDCGSPIHQVNASNLLNGESQSCGCLRGELLSARTHTHGEAGVVVRSRLYTIWQNTKSICVNVSHKRYRLFGGMGIKLCTDWQKDFVQFRDWAMASGYQEDRYLSRHDEGADFSPANCYWAPARNKPRFYARILYTAFDEMKSLAKWSEDTRCVVKLNTLFSRINAGWYFEDALTTSAGRGVQESPLTVWQTTKSLVAWTRDPRCIVSASVLASRIAAGWTPEDALTLPLHTRTQQLQLFSAFGEEKPLQAWIADPRCAVTYNTIQSRLKLGWSMERSLITSAVKPKLRLITAFGETKHFAAWVSDVRCCVKAGTLLDRLNHKWDSERALTTPAAPIGQGRLPSPDARINRISTGDRFHHLTVIASPVVISTSDGKRLTRFLCRCDCGNDTTVLGNNLTAGSVKSCGCLVRTTNQKRRKYPAGTPHGIASPLYTCWRYIRAICQRLQHREYSRYGGLGIRVCDAWQDYDTFRTWALEAGYREGFMLMRQDQDADFSPQNCAWVDNKRHR